MSKKTLTIKIIAMCIQIIPILVVFGIYCPVFVSRWDKALSAGTIVVSVILMCIFRDAVKKIFQRPSAFIFSLIIFISCILMSSIGDQLLVISATSLISGLVALPLNTWYNFLTRPVNNEDLKKVGK